MITRNLFSLAGASCPGKLAGGVLLAASGLFSRIRRWVTSATGLRINTTHSKEGPPAQPDPVAGHKLYALISRPDGQMMPLEVAVPKDTPLPQVEAAALWEIATHPATNRFSTDYQVEQISLRPRHNRHLRTAMDKLVEEQNKRARFELECG